MEKWLFVVRTNCVNVAREGEFNEWYNNVHIPDILKIPGVKNGRRFLNPEWCGYEQGSYLTLYEIETNDIENTKKLMLSNLLEMYKKGRLSDSIALVNLSFYKPIFELSN